MPMSNSGDSASVDALVTHLQETTESVNTALARELHDDLGGLLVSATMDLSSATRRLHDVDPLALTHFARVKDSLEAAIDLSRRMVEELRPSILDNFGLFAALRWQLKKSSQGFDTVCTDTYPDAEPTLAPGAVTALFRVAQEALAMTFRRGSVRCADLNVRVEDDAVWMRFTDDGIPVMSDGEEHGAATSLASMHHRIRTLGGTVDIDRLAEGRTVLTARLPLTRPA